MNRPPIIPQHTVIRFGKGSHAIMRILKYDTLCGYTTYHGVHLYGENISIADSGKCKPANKEDLKIWENFEGQRNQYTRSIKA